MKPLCCGLLAACLLLLAPLAARAVEAPPIAARAWLLLDYRTGAILNQHNADQALEPASLTKLMTAYRVFGALKAGRLTLQSRPAYSLKARLAGGSRLPLDPANLATVEQLLQGMIVLSANDAAVQLAEAVDGSEERFVAGMNDEARRLKLVNTRYVNASGQPAPGHLSSAHDVALLAAAIVRDYPMYYPLYSMKSFRWNGSERRNSNLLLWRDATVDGLKTGTTRSAGFCIVASAQRGERRLIAVVLGASSEEARAVEAQKLLNYGMQAWETPRLYEAGQNVATLPVWQGVQKQVALRTGSAVYVTVPQGSTARLKARLQARQPLLAPLRAGQTLGRVVVSLDGRTLAEFPVLAASAVASSGWLSSSWDRLRLWWSRR